MSIILLFLLSLILKIDLQMFLCISVFNCPVTLFLKSALNFDCKISFTVQFKVSFTFRFVRVTLNFDLKITWNVEFEMYLKCRFLNFLYNYILTCPLTLYFQVYFKNWVQLQFWFSIYCKPYFKLRCFKNKHFKVRCWNICRVSILQVPLHFEITVFVTLRCCDFPVKF